MLDIYTDYLICQNKYATATGLSDMVDGEFSHDKVTRFLRQEDFDSKMLWKYVKSAVRKHETQNGVFILDDSIEDKPYTDENEVNCWHYSLNDIKEVYDGCSCSTWELSIDKNTCSRPDDACWKDLENVSEEKLLAAMAYGESHWSNVYEEMAGIASAIIRRRDAAGFESVNMLVKKKPHFSYVVYNKNERFVKLMCGGEKKL